VKKVWKSVPHSEVAVKRYQQRPFLQSCYFISTDKMSMLQDFMSRDRGYFRYWSSINYERITRHILPIPGKWE
jgi:hypothetical protein